MTGITALTSAVTASFLASLVEVVEAFTIILAVGLTRGWRPALRGAISALLLLAVIVAIFGPLISLVPIHALQYVVGLLLILFGMRWLRKAILRASGYIALHDEEAAFARETDEMQRIAADRQADRLAAIAAFKAVLLEGTEVVFIVIAVGTARHMTIPASLGALGAVLVVTVLGLFIHKPLAQVPENTLKFVVGLMLTAFGIFWTGEGMGADWPGADLALLYIFAVLAAFSGIAVNRLNAVKGATA